MGQERMTYQRKSFQKAQNFLQHREQSPVSAHRKDPWAGKHASLLSHTVLLHSYYMLHQHLISTPKSLSYYSLFFFPPLLHTTIKSRQSVIPAQIMWRLLGLGVELLKWQYWGSHLYSSLQKYISNCSPGFFALCWPVSNCTFLMHVLGKHVKTL